MTWKFWRCPHEPTPPLIEQTEVKEKLEELKTDRDKSKQEIETANKGMTEALVQMHEITKELRHQTDAITQLSNALRWKR